jgi:hypothetical protein
MPPKKPCPKHRQVADALDKKRGRGRAAVRREFGFTVALLMLVSFGGLAAADSGPAFFPTPPPGVVYRKYTGVLEDYSAGMKSGGVTVRGVDRLTNFFMSSTYSIDGVRILCPSAPIHSVAFPADVCPDWPACPVVGSTTVTILFWPAKMGTQTVYVSDHMTTSCGARRARRKQ